MNRYTMESLDLAVLARKQLNLPKNVIKPNFEDIELSTIFMKLMEEFYELRNELLVHKMGGYTLKEDIDKDNLMHEIGDVAACLVGLLVKINSMELNDERIQNK